MTLDTLTSAADWSPAAHASTVEALAGLDDRYRLRVWCDDGCVDCRALLPEFAAALEAASVPDDRVIEYEVERLPEGEKRGPEVEAYGIERIPTVVVERDGEPVARFEEGDVGSIAGSIAGQLAEGEAAD